MKSCNSSGDRVAAWEDTEQRAGTQQLQQSLWQLRFPVWPPTTHSLPQVQQAPALALAAISACTHLWRSCSCSLLLRGGSACAARLPEERAARSSSVPLPMRSRRLLVLSLSAAHSQASLSERG